jgi:tetratricopeptide (TPR) repeat protein
MPTERRCLTCGRSLPAGETECPACAARNAKASLRPETVLFLCFPALLCFFAITSFAVRRYNQKEQALGEQWFSKGEAALRQGYAVEAIEDFRTALAYARDNSEYQLQLALALVAGKRPEEARSYLLSLWNSEPESGPINLELGRLSAARGEVVDAVRFYHSAIYGQWEDDPAAHRRAASLELYQFLQNRGAKSTARAELMALAADLPPDPALLTQAGNLFLSAGDYDEALQQFRQALLLDRYQAGAQAGAGEAAFRKADYLEARDYLERAVRAEPDNAEALQLLATTNSILEIDPFDQRATPEERARRVVRAYGQAVARLESCAQERHEVLDTEEPQTALQTIYARATKMQPQASERSLSHDPETSTAIANLALEIEEITARTCGPPSGLDRALLLIAEKHERTKS